MKVKIYLGVFFAVASSAPGPCPVNQEGHGFQQTRGYPKTLF